MIDTNLVEVRYEKISDELVKRFPDLRAAYKEMLNWWGEEIPGPHIVYGEILTPYIAKLLQHGDSDEVARVFEFLEALSLSKDELVRELIATTVCEGFYEEPHLLDEAKKQMGAATLQHMKNNEKFWWTTPRT